MAVVIVKPTDTTDPDYQSELDTYNEQIDGIRRLASPFLTNPLTATSLPEDVIADPVYLDALEREVLRESAIDAADVSSLPADELAELVYLVQIRVAIDFIPQLPQLLEQSIFANDTRYADVDWEKRVERLEAIYLEVLKVVNPAANVVDTSTIPVQGTTTKSEEIDFDVPYYNRTELYGRNP